MKMFSLSPKQGDRFDGLELAEFVIDMGCRELSFSKKEEYTKSWSIEHIDIPKDKECLIEAMKYLINEHGFFTVSCANTFLIIPFDPRTFNVIITDGADIPPHSGIDVVEATDVLDEYHDMYRNFGFDQVFDNKSEA